MFLSIVIVTYKRPNKLLNLLNCFEDSNWKTVRDLKAEIIICDDFSNDDTAEVCHSIIEKLLTLGWNIRYITRDINVRNDENLFLGYEKDANGEYCWTLCDDDIVIVEPAIRFILELHSTRPMVAICGFEQGIKHKVHNLNLANQTTLYDDFRQSFLSVINFPKTSSYIMRRSVIKNLDQFFYSKLNFTLYSWIAICILLIDKVKNNRLLFFAEICTKGDQHYGALDNYSYRVFANLDLVIKYALEELHIKPDIYNFNPKSEDDLLIEGLMSHYSYKSEIFYKDPILKIEINLFKKRLSALLLNVRFYKKLLKLLFYWVVDLTLGIKRRYRNQ